MKKSSADICRQWPEETGSEFGKMLGQDNENTANQKEIWDIKFLESIGWKITCELISKI